MLPSAYSIPCARTTISPPHGRRSTRRSTCGRTPGSCRARTCVNRCPERRRSAIIVPYGSRVLGTDRTTRLVRRRRKGSDEFSFWRRSSPHSTVMASASLPLRGYAPLCFTFVARETFRQRNTTCSCISHRHRSVANIERPSQPRNDVCKVGNVFLPRA